VPSVTRRWPLNWWRRRGPSTVVLSCGCGTSRNISTLTPRDDSTSSAW